MTKPHGRLTRAWRAEKRGRGKAVDPVGRVGWGGSEEVGEGRCSTSGTKATDTILKHVARYGLRDTVLDAWASVCNVPRHVGAA